MAGRMLEHVIASKLEDYVEANICKPLGIKDMTFKLQPRPDMNARRAEISVGNEHDDQTKLIDDGFSHRDTCDDLGIATIFVTPEDDMKVLYSLLANDGKLLRLETVQLMLQPHLSKDSQEAVMNLCSNEDMNRSLGRLLPMNVKKDHSLLGLLLQEDLDQEAWRKRGAVSWCGFANVFWVGTIIK